MALCPAKNVGHVQLTPVGVCLGDLPAQDTPSLPVGEDWAHGGFVATQVSVANYQSSTFARLSANQNGSLRKADVLEQEPLDMFSLAGRDSTAQHLAPDLIAHGVEFVASPGKGEKLQRTIPEAMRNALGKSGSFAGCMVLVSEQESRLVTVITLWKGSDRARQCDENSNRVRGLLTPYVDSWLRTRRLTAFLSAR